MEIFGQYKVPRQLSKIHLKKLEIFNNKIESLIKVIGAERNTKGRRI